MTTPILDRLSLIAIGVLLTLQVGIASSGIRLARDVISRAHQQIVVVAAHR